MKNWMPIPLINADVKIAPRALAGRIKRVILKVIFCDQTAYDSIFTNQCDST